MKGKGLPLPRDRLGFMDDETGNRHEVKDNIVVGREAPATVLYAIPTISKRHFTIRKQAGGFCNPGVIWGKGGGHDALTQRPA